MNNTIFLFIAFTVGLLTGSYINNNHWQAKWNEAEKTASQNQINAVNEVVKKYNKRINELQEITDETEKKLVEIQSINDSVLATNDSLQQSFTDSLQRPSECTDNSGTVRERAAKATDKHLQSVLFERITRRAIEYAKIADENRAAGLACEMSYNSIRL